LLAAHDQINLIRRRRHKLAAASCRHARADAFDLWADYTGEMAA
jgi:putative transposase